MMKKTGSWDRYGKRLQNLATKSEATLERSVARQSALLASDIKKNIRSSGRFAGQPFEPIKPSTIARKGSSKPLIDTGTMMNSVAARKIGQATYAVGIPGDASNKGQTVSEYARIHEYGGVNEHGVPIVARPFIGPTVDKMRNERIGEIRKAIKKLFE